MLGNFIDNERKILTIILMGYPCKWNKCSHCYFHEEASTDKKVIIERNNAILNESFNIISENSISNIKIFNGGSFFELPKELYSRINEISKNKTLSIETRPEFITLNTIKELQTELKSKNIKIFIGFDSYFEEIRNNILNKGIPQSEIERISKIKHPQVQFYSYVIFGVQGITEESVKESVNTFNLLFSGTTAIEFRAHKGIKLKKIQSTSDLKQWLSLKCLIVDLIGEDEQWKIKLK